ncbi:enoyl-CoA hydratase/isomerase family protein [Ochrobactrum vermis]|uniref:Enoyl-CoA hydratase/isomerase family protein n=1 Tax=Ochrobactrum vermis TaxID=1827297 RepID=A0ABU8PMZ5_9HYPH|nr:enoyl-CoA hydratase/isomerase family protein [Ochrobactrum vermis]PQZ27008.1 enoyl-CoA hydratase [Ochrobactrum vermis]
MTTPILVDLNKETGVSTITFNRPEKYNAIDEAMAAAFHEAVQAIASDKGIRCVVLKGAGKAFMAGGDVAAFAADPDRADLVLQRILRHMHPALLILQQLPAPVIAAVHGPAAGAGLSLVLSADYAICSQLAEFILAYDRLATVPDCGGTWYLRQKLGPRAALSLMLKGGKLNASQAREIGIVNDVVEDSSYHEQLAALIQKIATGPTRAFGLFKQLLAADLSLAAQLEAEKAAFMEATYTQDFQAAIRNFPNKQPVQFLGY